MDLSPYRYLELDEGEIRVLSLEPGVFGSPLRAHFQKNAILPEQPKAWRPESDNECSSPTVAFATNSASPIHAAPPDITRLDLQSALPSADAAYEAISYAWGSSETSHEIIIDEQYRILITESLFNALQRFRLKNDKRLLWADAVCINQNDLKEKSTQVDMMGRTYSRAACVLVWLGKSEGLDGYAFSLIERVSRGPALRVLSEDDVGNYLYDQALDCKCCQTVAFSDAKHAYDIAAQGLRSLLERPYWQRLWVVQETSLASKCLIQSGTHVLPLRMLGDLTAWVHYRLASDSSSMIMLKKNIDISVLSMNDLGSNSFWSDDEHINFTSLLHLTTGKQCSDPRDRIYAIRAMELYRGKGWQNIPPDYSVEPCDLFQKTTFSCLTSIPDGLFLSRMEFCHPAVLLAIAPLTRQTKVNDDEALWPSWTPDFHNSSQLCRQKLHMYNMHYLRKCDPQYGSHEPNFGFACRTPQAFPGALEVTGYIFDRIMDVLPASQLESVVSRAMKQAILRADDRQRQFHADSIVDGERTGDTQLKPWLEKCGRFLELSRPQRHNSKDTSQDPASNHVHVSADEYLSYPGDFWSYLEETSSAPSQVLKDMEHVSCTTCIEIVAAKLTVLLNKAPEFLRTIELERLLAVVKTKSSVLAGWVPPATLPDDGVCVLDGAPFPFVIRKAKGEDAFQIIGDAWFPDLQEHIDAARSAGAVEWIRFK